MVLYGYRSEPSQLKFLGREEEIRFDTDVEVIDLIVNFLQFCNGTTTIDDIRKNIPNVSDEVFESVVRTCVAEGIVCDSRELFFGFHQDSGNPMQFVNVLSPTQVNELVSDRTSISGVDPIKLKSVDDDLGKLLRKRKSSSQMSDGNIPADLLGGLLFSIYSYGDSRSVPSAGKLYPLSVYVAVCGDNQDLARGLYRYDPEKFLLFKTETRVTHDIVNRVLDSNKAETASFVVFISADLGRMAKKYANRGYRYAFIEAGHSAQNAYLFCAEHDIGVREYGGFQDKSAADFLGLDYPRESVMIALLVGKEVNTEDSSSMPVPTIAWNLREALVGIGKPVEWLSRRTVEYEGRDFSKVVMMAKYRSPYADTKGSEDDISQGTSVSSDEASIKALAEAFERYSSGLVRVDEINRADSLKDAFLDPRVISPLSGIQYKELDLNPFSENKVYEWVSGYRWSSKNRIMVPIDNVYYPLNHRKLGRKLIHRASSSGVAAHFDASMAQEKALLELIERDAVCLTWYAKREVTSIPVETLGDDIAIRCEYWKARGWSCEFLNLTLDSVPVVLAVIYSSSNYPSMVSGASAHFAFGSAALKALDEAESMLMMTLTSKRVDPPHFLSVFSPMDHGRLYFESENLDRVRWLLDSEERVPDVEIKTDIFKLFDPVVLDLTPSDFDCGLKVYRLISERLLPINFGYGNEYYGHNRFTGLGLTWKQERPSFPHFFA
ncbi:MAG: YcaO-like family protein [Minisyncoccia bacterium]